MRINLTLLLQVAGVMHRGLMRAGLLMPKVVNLRAHLAGLPRSSGNCSGSITRSSGCVSSASA